MTDYRRMLTLDQVAELCGVTTRTAWTGTTRGLKFLRVGRRIRVRPEDLDAFVAAASASGRLDRERERAPPSRSGRKRSAARAKRDLERKGAI